MIQEYQGFRPKLGTDVFIAKGAQVIGQVCFEQDVSFWYNSVARGDVDKIFVGARSNIQDLVMLHITEGFPLHVGAEVSVGHQATLHGCHIEDNCLIGMGATILDGVVVGKNSLVASGSVLPPGKTYPAYSMIKGSPGKVVRELNEKEVELYGQHFRSYIDLKNSYLDQKLS